MTNLNLINTKPAGPMIYNTVIVRKLEKVDHFPVYVDVDGHIHVHVSRSCTNTYMYSK